MGGKLTIPDRLEDLIEYELWALRRLLEALRESPAPKYKSTLTFAHILNAYVLWYERIVGKRRSVDPWGERSIEECEAVLQETEATFREFVSNLGEGDLERQVAYQNTKGASFENTVRDILMHLVIHSSHHRGQVNALIRGAGAEPAIIDYIQFVRKNGT